jgi:hypothetical protein
MMLKKTPEVSIYEYWATDLIFIKINTLLAWNSRTYRVQRRCCYLEYLWSLDKMWKCFPNQGTPISGRALIRLKVITWHFNKRRSKMKVRIGHWWSKSDGDKPKYSEKKPVPLWPAQMSHGFSQHQIRASEVSAVSNCPSHGTVDLTPKF